MNPTQLDLLEAIAEQTPACADQCTFRVRQGTRSPYCLVCGRDNPRRLTDSELSSYYRQIAITEQVAADAAAAEAAHAAGLCWGHSYAPEPCVECAS